MIQWRNISFLLDRRQKILKLYFQKNLDKILLKFLGCQAQVWLVPYLKNNLLYFHSDSDAFISKGMVTILCDIYGGNTPEQINNSDLNLLDDLDLNILLTPGRRNGVFSMLLKIKAHAKSHIV